MGSFRLTTGEPVVDRREDTSSVKCVALRAALERIQGGPPLINITVNLTCRLRGRPNAVPLPRQAQVIWLARPGKSWVSPFVLVDRHRVPTTNAVTVVLERHCSYYIISLAHWGEPTPPEVGDEPALMRETQRLSRLTDDNPCHLLEMVVRQSRQFWGDQRLPGTHAMRIGCSALSCTRCGEVVPVREVREAVDGAAVLCRDCDGS